MKIVKNANGDILKAQVISGLPDEFEDITDVIENPEYADTVPLQHLTFETIPATEEVVGDAEHWSDGTTKVYNINDIPTILDANGDPILDPSFVRVDAVEYQPAQPEKYRLVKKANADAEIAQAKVSQVVKAAIDFGNQLMVEFATENVVMGITQDGMTKAVRQAMSEVTSALQTGSLHDAVDEIDSIPAEAKDGKYITDARLAEYKQKIQDYLGA